VCGCSTVQRSIRLNSFHVCGYSGTIGVGTEVHWLCDVSSCLAVDGKRLQGSFSRTDVRTLVQFLVLLGKSALECCRVLKKGIGALHLSYETVRLWVNAIKNGRKEIDNASRSRIPTSATDERHMEQVKSVLDRTCSISRTAIAMEV
jgi:hypothetical protein